jgi:NADH-quinone oxidoreductase subunit L
VAAIGIFTAILAASIALTQNDIKRVLAYSTLSQLGYMFAALGVGAWVAAIFHLMTHGFFKGLLFLDSGSVIHAVHEEQDMRRMGGLSRKIPITYWTMLIGSLAIAGIPPLAGFFSKDEILGEAFKNGFLVVWAIGLLVAGMTAFYMFRLMGMTFWGAWRGPKELWDRIHESARSMTIPLVLLAIASVFIGMFLGLPLGDSRITQWLEPVFAETIEMAGHAEAEYQLFGIDGVLILASVAVATVGVIVALRLFGVDLPGVHHEPEPVRVRGLSARVPFLYRASLNKWWFDELYDLLFIRIGGRVAASLWWFDRVVVDGTVNGIGTLATDAGRGLRQVQTGRVQNYALGIAIGLLLMAGSYLLIAGR